MNVGVETIEAEGKPSAGLRLSLSDIDAMVARVEYHVFENRLTVCCMLLNNGFILVGESAAFNGAVFDAAKGREIAYKNARSKVFMLESYRMKQLQYEEASHGRS